MNLNRNFTRVAVAGASVAMAAAGLVATTTGAANATPVTTTNLYFCAQSVSPTLIPVIMSYTSEPTSIPGTVPAGLAVAKASPLVPTATVSFSVPAAALTGFQSFGIKSVGLTVPGFHLGFGDSTIPYGSIKTTVGKIPKVISGPVTVSTPKPLKNGAFNLPSPGSSDITLPSSFAGTVVAAPLGAIPVTCSLADPAVQAGFGLDAQNVVLGSTMAVQLPTEFTATKAPAKVKKLQDIKISAHVGVAALYGGIGAVPTGSVAVLDGATPVGGGTIDAKGNVKITITGGTLAPGAHSLSLGYAGDTNVFGAAGTPFTVTVGTK